VNDDKNCSELVRLAQLGQQGCLDRLVETVELRLRAYIYRVTLDHDLTGDMVQETLLEMIKSLKNLQNIERFWPWLYRIAHSKVQQHYRQKHQKPAYQMSALDQVPLNEKSQSYHRNALEDLIHQETAQKVLTTMGDLKQQHRAVLSLRCFEQMSYSQIAVALECSEMTARIHFFRAKQSLKKHLTHRGLGKGTLLISLGLFAKLTSPAGAASQVAPVTAASTKVGITATVLGAAGTKAGVAAITLAAGLCAVAALHNVEGFPNLLGHRTPHRSDVKSIHYTTQSRQSSDPLSSLSKGAYEQWYYFPEDIDGPMMLRMQRWTPEQTQKQCSWLQDDQANYYCFAGEKDIIYISNYRLWCSTLRTRRLPTDAPELAGFLDEVEGSLEGVEYLRDQGTGLLISSTDDRFVDARNFLTTYEYNTLSENDFQYEWPKDVPVIDQRDPMHRQGWASFRIQGEVSGEKVQGIGRIPFVYKTCKETPPWLKLDIGRRLQIIDTDRGAYLCRADGQVIGAYPAGTFFSGLARPWMGLHTVDIIRRDAAEQQIWFSTTPYSENQETVTITLPDRRSDNMNTDIVYTIDMERDLVTNIKFLTTYEGNLQFVYSADQIDQPDEDILTSPEDLPKASPKTIRKSPGILWLIQLVEGTLG
jgi:RNA polymerase sigma-70 factor (ECF subfamily)